jgi:tetratricopeptide (TPR) repeat protein
MDPHCLAADYNLGILYKRELRNPDAEAALRQVAAADAQDPATWFNLGPVYSADKKFDECLDAYHHVVEMGFGRGQNFYVAALFRTFTALSRMKRQDEAQQVLQRWQGLRDRVPAISLQESALEGGKYGSIQVPPAASGALSPGAPVERLTFADLSQKLGLSVAPASGPACDPQQRIKLQAYSTDFARQKLLPLFASTIAVGDYDQDGHPDLFLANPPRRQPSFPQ